MTAHDRPVKVEERTYTDGRWERRREHDIRFLFNTTPMRYLDGMWIAGGRVSPAEGKLPQIPAVAVRDIAGDWTVQPFDGPWTDGEFPLWCPETAVYRKGLRAIVRNDDGQPWTFRREDGAWRFTGESTMPIAGVKMYGGTLSDGRDFLFYNERTPQNDRSRLVMALREGDGGFTKLYLIADGYDDALRCGPYWHYPSVCEWDGTCK